MNKLFIHIPTFVETDVYPSYEFETIEQLLGSGNIDRYLTEGEHLELSRDTLMSVSEDKLRWWVIGRLKTTEGIDLPEWKSYHRVKFDDGRIEIRGDVVMSSGNWVEFADGSRATNLWG